jgi:hypothetical protein
VEAPYWHLPIVPFHGELQKVKGKVDGFTELNERFVNKCSYADGKSRK